MSEEAKKDMKNDIDRQGASWEHGIAGVMSGGISTSLLHPLDLVKTRLQVQDGLLRANAEKAAQSATQSQLIQYNGTVGTFRTVLKNEGVRGLYQGLTPSVLGSSMAWGAYFVAYTHFKRILQNRLETVQLPAFWNIIAATQAGIVVGLALNPIWVIKTRMQIQTVNDAKAYRGIFDAARTILKEEGWKGFYKGIIPALLGVSHGAMQFMAYEEFKKFHHRYTGEEKMVLST
eukprot:TRINITY_DN2284_c0_g2_i2.p1 TRINITY_DN2284_c0_g2~~TRINITY_DN2284_c0_g2_i2.p1  ORF type:complete len:255 (+),score=60.39 TRINITY_DN2284_c0_g2_i2:71-766(+)